MIVPITSCGLCTINKFRENRHCADLCSVRSRLATHSYKTLIVTITSCVWPPASRYHEPRRSWVRLRERTRGRNYKYSPWKVGIFGATWRTAPATPGVSGGLRRCTCRHVGMSACWHVDCWHVAMCRHVSKLACFMSACKHVAM